MFDEIDAVILDLDGTIVDSMWLWKAIDVEYLSRFGWELPATLQSDIEGMSFTETAIYMKERFQLPDSADKIKETWNQMAWDKYENEVTLKPGVLSFLKELKRRKIVTGIATSNSKELVDLVLHSLKIDEYFNEIHTSCEVDKGKPAPDIYLFVAKKLGVQPSRCMVFEDIPKGICAGKAAGMKVCAVEDEFSRGLEKEKRLLSDYFIKDYHDIIWKDTGGIQCE